jgi:hypothetical protein
MGIMDTHELWRTAGYVDKMDFGWTRLMESPQTQIGAQFIRTQSVADKWASNQFLAIILLFSSLKSIFSLCFSSLLIESINQLIGWLS